MKTTSPLSLISGDTETLVSLVAALSEVAPNIEFSPKLARISHVSHRQGGRLAKLKAGTVAKSILRRVVHPTHIVRAANLHRTRKANRRNFDDLQLTLYSEIF